MASQKSSPPIKSNPTCDIIEAKSLWAYGSCEGWFHHHGFVLHRVVPGDLTHDCPQDLLQMVSMATATTTIIITIIIIIILTNNRNLSTQPPLSTAGRTT